MKQSPYIKEILSIFNSNDDMRTAHKATSTVLDKMSKDRAFLNEVVKHNLSNAKYLKNVLHYPTLSMDVFKNNLVDILINIFPSLPDQNTNISHHSIHHHGNLLLSTIALSGSGYYTMLFNKDHKILPTGNISKLHIASEFQNHIGNYTFCDSNTPHLVFFPKDMSSTLVVWSKDKKSAGDKIKKIPLPPILKKNVASVLRYIGLHRHLNINVTEELDYYPDATKKEFRVIKDRIRYPNPGSNEHFIQNVMYYLRSINFDDYNFLEELLKKESTTEVEKKWINIYLRNETFEPVFESAHLNISSKVNISKQDVYNAINKS